MKIKTVILRLPDDSGISVEIWTVEQTVEHSEAKLADQIKLTWDQLMRQPHSEFYCHGTMAKPNPIAPFPASHAREIE